MLGSASGPGFGVTARAIELLAPDLRVLTEAERLPRRPDMSFDLHPRDARVSAPAIRLFESMGEVAGRQSFPAGTVQLKQRRKPG